MKALMVRLYFQGKFTLGQRVKLEEFELHYWGSVKRAQGPVQLFNSEGQWANGDWAGKDFLVTGVELAPQMLLPVSVALAIPDREVIDEVIPMLSEIGVQKLFLFPAKRSQTSIAKLKGKADRWSRLSIESARQCLRGRPLEIDVITWEDLLRCSDSLKLCFSEVELENLQGEAGTFTSNEILAAQKELSSVLCVFGCEGGWTAEEFSVFKKSDFLFCHIKIPVMKVATAVSTGLGGLIATFFSDRMKWSSESTLKVDPSA